MMAKIKQLSKSQYERLAAFRYALRQFIHFSEQAAQAAGITPQQHQALLAVKGFPGRDRVTVGELAERLQLRHHSAVGLVDRLVSEKLVARAASSQDRRRVFVELTRRGEHILEELSAAHSRQLKRLSPELKLLLQHFSPGQDPPLRTPGQSRRPLVPLDKTGGRRIPVAAGKRRRRSPHSPHSASR